MRPRPRPTPRSSTPSCFAATTDYKKLNVFEYRRQADPLEYCPDAKGDSFIPDDLICRVQYKRRASSSPSGTPSHYAVVQVQQVIPQETQPGEAPPLPVVDPTKPVISVVLVRDLGDVRLIPVLYFVISLQPVRPLRLGAALPGQDAEEEQGDGGGRSSRET